MAIEGLDLEVKKYAMPPNRTLRFFRLAMRKHTAAQSNVTTAVLPLP